ncbi:RagB/SusD family nutrient uptake outer membrane protein [Lutibacter sp.]|uniref:RagB/SusD family nutrient uptake outer membrane protein n=1 Tax=Lutibacter sp. TaxID=1925666 RepID=UPI0025C2F18E|nr:RagB/SusD family nutrient uptake outer membrane protein [Lutibacter sp.]MCF6180902.1 RagB/SusD family nutrient uptake outer membrane protein [Lutibacter sp.]
MKIHKLKIHFSFVVIAAVLTAVSCTDLKIKQTDSVFADSSTGGFTGVTNPESSLDDLYNGLYGQIGNQANLFALNEVTTDEFVVPTRGTDWGDNGVWRTLHAHTWSPIHSQVKDTWNGLNQTIFNAGLIIDDRSSASAPVVAQAKFLRAFAMFWVNDMYGQVPFRTPDEGPEVNPTVMTRVEAVDFMIKDLTEALPDLATQGPNGGNQRASKAAANFLLAKIYLNKNIYSGNATADAGDMNKVIQYVDAITADGYSLMSNYFDIFRGDKDNGGPKLANSETIWWAVTGTGNRIWDGLHYNQGVPDNEGGGWNGFSTLADFYDKFEGSATSNEPGNGQEERRGFVPTDGSHYGIGFGFLVGQQYDATGAKLKDRAGNDLVFTKDFPGLIGNNERTGIRVIKYHPEDGAFTNFEIFFRYADAYLMKAEAIMRGGTSSETALDMVNNLRTIRSATPLAAVTEQTMLDERGRELYKEFWRRNDLIRFGKFADAWGLKDADDAYRALFPIPSTALLSNPNLTQNPGY